MTTTLQRIRSAWLAEMTEVMRDSDLFQRMTAGTISTPEYAGILSQLHLHVREHPQALAVLTLGLRGEQRTLVRGILSHARAETGHDELALNDLAALGHDTAAIPSMRPLPATAAILGFMHSLLLRGPALGFLGYIFHLEFLPTHFGAALAKGLLDAGIPPAAMTFLNEHAEADVGHNKLMELYLDKLLLDERDEADVIYTARVTARLYERMLAEAARAGDNCGAWGVDSREMARDRSAPVPSS